MTTMKLSTKYTVTMNEETNKPVVSLVESDFAIPSSKYVLDDKTFETRVSDCSKYFLQTTIRNDASDLLVTIDQMKSNDTTDVATLNESERLYTALVNFADGIKYNKTSLSDGIALVTAYTIVRPKYVRFNKYADSTAIINLVRMAYDDTVHGISATSIEQIRKNTRDSVIAFVSPYFTISDSDKSTVYKNIKPRLNLEETRQLIDTVGAYTLKYSKSGISSKRMNDNMALVQMFLYVLRTCFDIKVQNGKKADTHTYLVF